MRVTIKFTELEMKKYLEHLAEAQVPDCMELYESYPSLGEFTFSDEEIKKEDEEDGRNT